MVYLDVVIEENILLIKKLKGIIKKMFGGKN